MQTDDQTAGQPPLEPDPDATDRHEPPADATPPPADPPKDDPPAWEPKGRLEQPEETNGVYLILWAHKPSRKADRPEYREAIFVKAHSAQRAKEIVVGAEDQLGEFLREQATHGKGILVRAIPAMHWPADVQTTTYERPAPVLVVR